DGRWLASSSTDGHWVSGTREATIKLWDLVTGQEVHTLVQTGPDDTANGEVHSLAFSPDGQRLYSASEVTWSDGGLGKPRGVLPGGPLQPQSHGTVKVWDVASGKELHSWEMPVIKVMAISPDGQRLATLGPRGGSLI